MWDKMARVLSLEPKAQRRILVVSDIHGNLPYFKGLLEKARFSEADELIIDGDFLEKGGDSLGTLRYIMELSRKGNVHCVCGNCDDWHTVFDFEGPEYFRHTLSYVQRKKCGLLWDMCREQGLDPLAIDAFAPVIEALREPYREEWAFLSALPHAIETERFIFAHGGVVPGTALREHKARQLQHCDSFMTKGYVFDKWVIVGHWPVMLYGENTVSANPIINREQHIVSIDGGCVLKDDGQLNALIIPHKDSEDFSFVSYDPFPERRVLEEQAGSESSYYIRWGDSEVQVLKRGGEFSRCRHVRTGYEMDILTKYLFTENEITGCNDCTDYRPELHPGDTVSVVEETSRGYFVKHKGVSGWYGGRLE